MKHFRNQKRKAGRGIEIKIKKAKHQREGMTRKGKRFGEEESESEGEFQLEFCHF